MLRHLDELELKTRAIDDARRERRLELERRRTIGEPLLLVTTAHPSLGEHEHPNLGRLVQPRHYSSVRATAGAGYTWAADNDCFQGLDAPAYFRMVERLPHRGCAFVVVPDVVGDAVATARQFEAWSSCPARQGYPVALVAQDGLEELTAWLAFSWHRIDALFVGGTTEWKLGPAARELAREAYSRGKWVHWGRVNTRRRVDYIRSTGACDSFDGSKWARFRKTYLDGGLAMTAAAPQLALEVTHA